MMSITTYKHIHYRPKVCVHKGCSTISFIAIIELDKYELTIYIFFFENLAPVIY
jgi:hypothetical protein